MYECLVVLEVNEIKGVLITEEPEKCRCQQECLKETFCHIFIDAEEVY